MKTVGIFEARTHLSKILRDVEGGAVYVITRNGVAVARIEPIPYRNQDSSAAVDELHRFVSENKIRLGGGITIREMIEDGRR